MSQLYTLWKNTAQLPVVGSVVGKRVFSFAFAKKAPYFASIHPRVVQLCPDYAEVLVPNRRSNHNHIGTVHAIALCNGLEMAMGALAEATIPADRRWIPKGMEVDYTAKATSDITCIAETEPSQWTADLSAGGYDLPVRVKGIRTDGTVVIEGVINLWISAKKK